jgi:hypothetical protein
MFGLEALRLGPVLVPRVPASTSDGPTELLGLIVDAFRLFIVGFVLKSELETLYFGHLACWGLQYEATWSLLLA